MEFKEYINIIKKSRKLFFGTIFVIVAISLGYFYFLPVRYDASLTLNITRAGSQETADYKYDDYYRLQADERFADTLVEWLKSPRTVNDICTAANLDTSKIIKDIVAEKRSSQVVAVSFSADTASSAQKIAAGAVNVLNGNTEALNMDQKENTWFKLVYGAPVIVKYHPNYEIIFLAALCLGIFLAFWAVMIKHYLE
ncbi:MAG: hypothetical protein WC022_03840 [Parcubacteria group bacterium]